MRAKFPLMPSVFILLSLSLVFSATLTGTVTNQQRVLMVGSTVKVYQNGEIVASSTIDGNGKYNFDLPNGQYLLLIERQGYSDTLFITTVNGSTTVNIILSPPQWASVYGQVFAPSPIGGNKIYAMQNEQVISFATIQANGAYALTGLQAGEYVIYIPPGEYAAVRETITLTPGESNELNLVMHDLTAQPEDNVSAPNATGPTVYYTLLAPLSAQVGDHGTVLLNSSQGPLASAVIAVRTPSALAFNVTTNAQGEATLLFNESGVYSFTFGNVTKNTSVVAFAGQENISLPLNLTSAPEEKIAKGEKWLEYWWVFLAIIVIVVAILMVGLLLRVLKEGEKKEGHKPKHAHEGPKPEFSGLESRPEAMPEEEKHAGKERHVKHVTHKRARGKARPE